MKKPLFLAVLVAVALASGALASAAAPTSATGAKDPSPGPQQNEAAPRWYPAAAVGYGRQLYRQHCAACHGEHAQGASDWREPGADGKYPAPPLNGTGHDWHHSLGALLQVIMNGSPGGQGNMPAWKGTLSPEQAGSTIAYFQSLWPDRVFAAWYQIELRAQQKRKQKQ